MKRTWIAPCLLLMVALFTACASQGLDVSKLEKSEYDAADQSKEVAMTLDDTTVAADTETLDLHFTNGSKAEYTSGLEPHLDIEEDGAWYVVPVEKDAEWVDIGYILPAGGEMDMEFDLQSFYGKLSAGHYRIVKPLYSEGGNTFAIAVFTIE